ncbi:MAG: hypothetical protein ACD_8C00138G0008 [uncultured bacterium]|nr:MAG: hypothetical protein ACD_8C00138G0008 [uncultured bacterium]
MKNYKLEHNLIGEENWPSLPSIFVGGIAGQEDVSADNAGDENEKIVQSWKNVVILKATSEKPTEFYVGFSNYAIVCYLKHEFVTDVMYAMRISPTDNRYFVLPKNIEDKILLEMVEVTTVDDEKYKDLILI